MLKKIKVISILFLFSLIWIVLISWIVNKASVREQSVKPLGKQILIENDDYVMKMDVEHFIPCVLMAQLPVDSPIELLKAQAVVLRTYILKEMGNDTQINANQLGLPYITYAQMEEKWFREFRFNQAGNGWAILGNLTGLGKSRVFSENINYINKAISKTNHKVLKNQGKLILPLYHQTSAGKTRAGADVLGDEYSYLKSVKCDNDVQQNHYIGVKYFSVKKFFEQLKKGGIIVYQDKKEVVSKTDMDLQEVIKKIDYSQKDKTGYVVFVKIADTKVVGEDFAKALNLNSTCFEIEQYEKGLRVTTKGVGHGFGLSLSYGKQLAKEGESWQDILKKFYNAVIVE